MLTAVYYSLLSSNIAKIKYNIKAKQNEIQIGDITHHYNQLITLVNFNTIKAIVNAPANFKPGPLDIIKKFKLNFVTGAGFEPAIFRL